MSKSYSRAGESGGPSMCSIADITYKHFAGGDYHGCRVPRKRADIDPDASQYGE